MISFNIGALVIQLVWTWGSAIIDFYNACYYPWIYLGTCNVYSSPNSFTRFFMIVFGPVCFRIGFKDKEMEEELPPDGPQNYE